MDDNKNKVLRLRDVVLYTVSAMLFMDQIALASSLGPSSLFWWLYVLVLLFLPMAMMTSELGTAFPANGGVYHWVRSAFGFRWGARVSWMYWVNNALWMPSVYTLFGSMLGAFYFPELSLWGKIAIGIALALLTAAFNVVALRLGKWLPNLGALLKLLAVLALGVGGLHFGWNHGFANDFSLDSIVPSSPGQMAALGVMVYGIMGTELACCSAAEMRNARRDIPRAVLISGLIVGAFNIFGTLGVLAAYRPRKPTSPGSSPIPSTTSTATTAPAGCSPTWSAPSSCSPSSPTWSPGAWAPTVPRWKRPRPASCRRCSAWSIRATARRSARRCWPRR